MKNTNSKGLWCDSCAQNVFPAPLDDGRISCSQCGKIIVEEYYSEETTFVKDAGGQSRAQGSLVSFATGNSTSRDRTLKQAFHNMEDIFISVCNDDDIESILKPARNFYQLVLERNFTKGRSKELVQAACLYVACRKAKPNPKPLLLIDFSVFLQRSVYELGSVYLMLIQVLSLTEDVDIKKPVDPSLFIDAFTHRLLNKRDGDVANTALKIIASMKRDWIVTGRKPSGLCGAALYISAIAHGYNFTKSQIVKVVHMCESTLTKRLVEFENTESGNLTLDEFTRKEKELERELKFGKQSASGMKSSDEEREVICVHKDQPAFAHGLCRECSDVIEDYGGLDKGLDPPAFQRAQQERMAKKNAEEDDVDNEFHGGDSMSDKLPDSENPSDIDDVEVDKYIQTAEEMHYKKIIWEEQNREYVEEQKAKEAAAAAAKKAYEENLQNCPEGMKDAAKLAAEVAAAVDQAKKERKQKRAADAKNKAPPRTAAEATAQVLAKRRLNSKINYDVLNELFDEPVSPNHKKSRPDDEVYNSRTANYNQKEEVSELSEAEYEDRAEDFAEEYEGDLHYGNTEEDYHIDDNADDEYW